MQSRQWIWSCCLLVRRLDSIQRVGGGLDSIKRPGGRRVLLPAEAELCNAVGLTEDEYWHFVELTDAYAPDEAEIRNDPVTIISLVVGLALSAVSALLAPKPQEPKQPPNIKTEDIKGRSRFAPQTNFDSVQELAKLGSVIPLIFARKGVRVTSSLLWSQMISKGIGQQLRVIGLFGSGAIEGRPDWASYAIGDTLLENYTNAKIALYFRPDGGRIQERSADRYPQGTAAQVPPNDAFSLLWTKTGQWEGYFSGTRTPGTQAQFGVYAPVPNGMALRLNWELTLKADSLKNEAREIIMQKRRKIEDLYARMIGVVAANPTGVVVRIDGAEVHSPPYKPHGVEDVRTAVKQGRIEADEEFGVGNEYMAGTGVAVAVLAPSEPWDLGYTKDIHLHWTEGQGEMDVVPPTNEDPSYSRLMVQRVALGTVSNNRSCEATEIGIKSTVFRQITGFSNVNSFPGQDKVEKVEDENGSLTLGTVQTYISRLSFFRLEVRELGVDSPWQDLSGGTIFCVQGRTPQPHYNFIRIYHPFGQYEYRMKPYPGNAALRYFWNQEVWLLRPGSLLTYNQDQFTVAFAGTRLFIDERATCNTEWIKGEPPVSLGSVIGVNVYQIGPPVSYAWTFVDVHGRITGSNQGGGKDGSYSGTIWTYTYNGVTLGKRTTRTRIPPSDPLVIGSDRYTPASQLGATSHRLMYESLRPSTPVTFHGNVAATGGHGSGAVFTVTAFANGFRQWTLVSGGSGYRAGNSIFLPIANVTLTVTTDSANLTKNNFNPHDAISDGITFQEEKSSHQDGPEHEIVYVNEQIAQVAPQYDKLCLAGLRIDSSKEWTTFSNLSAFFKTGVMVERLVTSGRSATNLLPEIAYALLTDPVIGAGTLIGANQVDRDRMKEAALFCQANDFTWDGVIDEKLNLREWIFENAGYCLLDFTILGGRFSLVPAVPISSDHSINFNGKPDIKALFTDGNIRNLKVSFLGPEERQLFRAVVTWRQDRVNGFPETRTLTVRLSDQAGGSDSDPEEAFDMAGFCTSQNHAMTFAKYALKMRKEIDHGLTFETTPQAAMNLSPGDYFRLASEVTHTSRFNNGSIGPDGSITSADQLNGAYPILFWEPGTVGVQSGELIAANNRTDQSALFGTVFTLNNSTTVDRVYKCESLSYAEDGLVEVAASHAPLTETGSLKVLQWGGADFVEEVN